MATTLEDPYEGNTAGPHLAGQIHQFVSRTLRRSLPHSNSLRSRFTMRQKQPRLSTPASPPHDDSKLCMSTHQVCASRPPHAQDLSCGILLLPQELRDDILHIALLTTLPHQQVLNASELSRLGHFDPTDLLPVSFSSTARICWVWMPLGPYEGSPNQLVTMVDTWFHFPKALQINSKTRNSMAEIFYRDAVFNIRDGCPRRWLAAVPRKFHDDMKVLTPVRGVTRRGCGFDCWIRRRPSIDRELEDLDEENLDELSEGCTTLETGLLKNYDDFDDADQSSRITTDEEGRTDRFDDDFPTPTWI